MRTITSYQVYMVDEHCPYFPIKFCRSRYEAFQYASEMNKSSDGPRYLVEEITTELEERCGI